jgi:copper(I)-binding protein
MNLILNTARIACALALIAGSATALAQTEVRNAWVRGTVAQQKSTGAYLQIQSAQGGRLVAVQSPLAGVAEIHEMRMEGNVMRMRAVAGIDLPPGQAVELKPGGYHVMLMELKQPLKVGDSVPLSLIVEGKGGQRETLQLQVPVQMPVAPGMPAEKHKH